MTSTRALVVGFSLLVATPAHGQEGVVDMAGSYRSSARETRVDVATWGEDCGPRPRSSTVPSTGLVKVTRQGAHLALAFSDRTVRTDACWSPNPTVRVTSTAATATRWRTECHTPEGEAKQERGSYAVEASSPNTLQLLEESEYDWQLNESHCVASVRVSQQLEREGTSQAPVPQTPTSTCTPGDIARLRIRPTETRLGPGERVCFTIRASDARGCPLPLVPGSLKWTLVKPEAATGTLSGGCFRAAATVADAEGRFRIVAALGSLRDEAWVSVVPTDLSDITARRSGGETPLDDAEGLSGIASELGIEAVVRHSSDAIRIALSLGLLALLVLLWVGLRQRARRLHETEPTGHANGLNDASAGASSVRPDHAAQAQLICPICRLGYPAGTDRCPRDGGKPILYAEFVRQAQASSGEASVCPACGSRLARGAQFCGVCGARARS